ncbi:MAG TPA: prolyl oligopeptidase family serine peptidase [Gemmatimonadaceae bacterium]|nr:prolyl oligopeptidase family serine peptidase [Gemmatimonadaceae bacterium]
MPDSARARVDLPLRTSGVAPGVARAALLATTCGCLAALQPPTSLQAQPRQGDRAVPATRATPVVDSLHGAAVADRFRWLESQTSPEVLAWIEAQNRYARQVLGPDTPARRTLAARLRELLDVPQSSPPRRGGEYEYFTLRRKGEEVAAIYRRRWTPNAPRVVPDSQYERVIDPLALRADGTTSVAIEGLSPDGNLLMYSVRDGGPDEITVKLRDLRTGRDLADSLPRALYAGLSFAPDGRGFYYVHRSRAEGPRFRYHGLGQSPGSDSLIFGEFLPPTHFLSVLTARRGRYRVYGIGHGWARNDIVVEDTQTGMRTSLTEGLDAHFAPQLVDDELWLRTDLDAPRGKLVAVDLANPRREAWRTVIPEGEDVLDAFTLIDGKLYVTYLRNASHRIAVFTRDGAPAGEVAVPPHATVTIRGGEQGKALLTVTSFTQPGTTWALDLASGTRTVHEASTVPFDTAAFEVAQHWYRSKDGTRAPLWIVQKRGHVRSRSTPALLHGYGGFAVSLGPRFDARAALWVERGGIYVQATLRGGNEFGEAWHKGGMLANKQNVFDDFTSAAQFLVDSGFTSPGKLAIRGVSNGGLLMGAALTQRPELFAAAFVGVPDLDLVRFPWFVTHNNAPALLEYGDARQPEQFEAIRRFSPYQNVRDGVKYPAILVQTGMNDTRVPPWQARRFTARLQEATASGKPVLLLHDLRSGHAGGRSMSGTVELATREMEFLLRNVGALR